MDGAPEAKTASQAAKPALGMGAAVGKSMALTALIAAAVGAVGLWESGGGSIFTPPPAGADQISGTDRDARAAAFASMAPLPLSPVDQREAASAIHTMGLAPEQEKALAAAAQAAPSPRRETVAQVTPAAQPRAAPASEPVRLAWLTLWDTDAEDGDVVRIDSRGYSRTVVLKKQPVTFAIPIPSDGVVKVTGVRDGEGGGITVGLASGASRAIFPIMSEGQMLGLRVKAD